VDEGEEEPVTADEFRKRLAASGAVEFGDSKLRLLSRAQTPAFAGPISGSVHYGIERSRLTRGRGVLSGTQDWLMILDDHLLWITGRVAVENNEQTLTVDHQFYPLTSVRASLRAEYVPTMSDGMVLRAAHLEVTGATPPLVVDADAERAANDGTLEPESVVLFAQHLTARATSR